MSSRKISIIAPCYNGENYVTRFLNSVLNQTYDNIELIIINDGSTDLTENILTEYEKKFEERKFEYIHMYQENQGIGAALNQALKYVTGEYLTWFGTDDYMAPSYAKELVEFLETNKQFALVRCEGYIVDKKDNDIILGRMSDGNQDKKNPDLFENAIMEKNFHFGYSVLRMDIFDEVNPTREIYPSREGQNWQLLLPVLYKRKSAFYEKPLYYVVFDSNSVSRIAHKSYERLKNQNQEYERILNTVINTMNISEREYYLKMIKVKYIRRRMLAAIDYGFRKDALLEYKRLKEENAIQKEDRYRYFRVKFSIVDKIVRLVKHQKKL